MNQPKVLVGAPVSDMHEYCFDEFLDRIKNFTYKNYDILLIENSEKDDFYEKIKNIGVEVLRLKGIEKIREKVMIAHNMLRERALEKNYDYLFILDQDTIPTEDCIEKFIAHKKDVVSGLYFSDTKLPDGSVDVVPLAYVLVNEDKGEMRHLNEGEIWQDGLIKIVSCGAGCMFISRKVLEKIKFRYEQDKEAWDDRFFGMDCFKSGFEMFLDNTVKCKHLFLKRPWKYKDLKEKL